MVRHRGQLRAVHHTSWFSHSAGDILRLLQHARFIIDSGRAQPTLVRKATSDRSRAVFALRILRFPGLPVARTLESSRDQAFMRRGATLCSLSMVECVGVVVCNRWFRYQYVIGRINNTLLSHFTAPDQTPFRWEVFAQRVNVAKTLRVGPPPRAPPRP